MFVGVGIMVFVIVVVIVIVFVYIKYKERNLIKNKYEKIFIMVFLVLLN